VGCHALSRIFRFTSAKTQETMGPAPGLQHSETVGLQMYLALRNGHIELMDARNFKEFYFEKTDSQVELPAAAITADPDGEHLWVSIEWLHSMGPKEDAEWAEQFGKMIEKVRPYGWISEDSRFVRGHFK